MFDSNSNNPQTVILEIRTTRLYIVLVTMGTLILMFLGVFTAQTSIYTVYKPSRELFEVLLAKYPDTMQCPCTSIKVSYNKFSSVNVTYHEICSSDLISNAFINQLYAVNATPIHTTDFVAIGSKYFHTISLVYERVMDAVNYYFVFFLSSEFESDLLLDSTHFQEVVEAKLENIRATILLYVNRGHQETLELSASNHLLSIPYNSFKLPFNSDGSISIEPSGFQNCSCLTQPNSCSMEAGFYSYDTFNDSFMLLTKVMGIRVGCMSFQSAFLSSLACWYSIDCYQMVRDP